MPEYSPTPTKMSWSWLVRMAWRDSRHNRSRLVLFISSIVFGIAALVAIYTFQDNISRNIDSQAATLIGADLSISTNKPVDKAIKPLLDSLGEQRSVERSFVSMVYFPKNGGTRLAQIRALKGAFPYYGSLETAPKAAGKSFRKNGRQALVDRSLMLQYNLKVNDSVKVGELTFLIAGVLNKAPGQTGISSSIARIVYIPLDELDKTKLVQMGSRINTNYYYKFADAGAVDKLAAKLDNRLEKYGLNYETVNTRKANTGRAFGDLTQFLSLVGFIALLLGCVGVASSVHIYIREKIPAIAIMRCMGVKARQAFIIYLLQIVAIGLIGSLAGAILGTIIQHFLPIIFKDLLPVSISTDISWLAIAQGVLLGVIISVLFAMLPLLSIRKISPLNTLRMSYENVNLLKDPARWLVYLSIGLFVILFTYFQLGSFTGSLFFTLGVAFAFLLLTLAAEALITLSKLLIRNSWSYLWRQGFANLYRPNNQTVTLMVSIGLSTAFICTLIFVQGMLVKQVTLAANASRANMILFDIQKEQKAPLGQLTAGEHLPIIQVVPIVTMRLSALNGKEVGYYRKDTTSGVNPRIFSNEYRATFRDSLTSSEKIISGKWIGKATDPDNVPVSIEEKFAQRNHLKIGDHLQFNVQGMPVTAEISSLRSVNWNRMQTNFLVVFPAGVLEDAPQFYAMLTHVPSEQASAKYQQAVIKAFPNISMIDLGQVLSVLDEIMGKIADIIKFMAAFSILTGLVVLISSVRISKYQRLQESVLLRTMGASRRQIFTINALEYFFLGALSALTGILISYGAAALLATFNFEVPFTASAGVALGIFAAVSLLTVVIGLLNSRGVLNKPPLKVLRRDI
ncbi:MAG: ABC transporter permease [Mucilaginibacter sp.]|nr:ABC transporter permease [Mucilaginibacter sp.]